MRTFLKILPTLAFLLPLLVSTPSRGHEPAVEEQAPEPSWKGSAGLSFLSTSGNTNTETLGLDLKLSRKPEPWGLEIIALYHSAKDEGETTAERSYANLRGTRALGSRWEVFVGAIGERDEFAGIDLRTVLNAGGTYNWLQGPKHLLSLDAGVTWTDEDRIEPEPDEQSLGGLAGLSYELKISENASFSERLVYYPNFETSNDWRLDSLTAVTASLTSRLALQLGYELRHRNQPIGDNDKTDTATKISLVANF